MKFYCQSDFCSSLQVLTQETNLKFSKSCDSRGSQRYCPCLACSSWNVSGHADISHSQRSPSGTLCLKFWLFWISAGGISWKFTFATSHLGQKQQHYSSGLHSSAWYFAWNYWVTKSNDCFVVFTILYNDLEILWQAGPVFPKSFPMHHVNYEIMCIWA